MGSSRPGAVPAWWNDRQRSPWLAEPTATTGAADGGRQRQATSRGGNVGSEAPAPPRLGGGPERGGQLTNGAVPA